MKNMSKRFFVVAVSLVFVSLSAQARPPEQGPRGPGGGPDRLEKMTETLQLNESQVEQLEVIMSDARELHEAADRDDSEAHCDIQAEEELQLIAILDEVQITSLEEMKNNRPSRPGRGGGRGPMNCE